MRNLREVWRLALSNGIPRRAFVVAMVVGSVLTIINQGDIVLSGGVFDWVKAVLTYAVPYLVSTHGAVSARMVKAHR